MPFLTDVAKRRKFINPRKLTFSAVDEFVRGLILIGVVTPIKNAVSLPCRQTSSYRMPFLTNVAKRRKFINPRKLTFSAVDEFVRGLILIGVVTPIKNAASLPCRQTSLDCM